MSQAMLLSRSPRAADQRTELQRLLGINKSVLSELAAKGIVTRGKKRGSYAIESVMGYRQHLREIAAGRGMLILKIV